MKYRRFIYIGMLVFSVLGADLIAQEIKLTDRPLSEFSKYTSPLPLYKLDGNSIKHYNIFEDKMESYDLVLPDVKDKGDLAFMYSFFTGATQLIKDHTIVLVDAYKTKNPIFYIDYNNNLDFTDDGKPLKFDKKDKSLEIALSNQLSSSAKSMALIKPMQYVSDESRDMVYKRFKDGPESKGKEVVEPAYWLSETRLNILAGDVSMGDEQFRIGLIDWNINGLYNDRGIDKFSIAPYQSDTMFTMETAKGVYKQDDKNLFAYNDNVYALTDIAENGAYVNIKQLFGEAPPIKLSEGAKLPDFTFVKMDETESSIYDFIEEGKFTYIDCWATWCKRCLSEIPLLNEVYKTHGSKLNVVTLNCADEASRASQYAQENMPQFTNGMANLELLDLLMVEGIPHGILLDGQGNIISLKTNVNAIEGFMENH